MTNAKTTKKALFASVMSLLLCVSMLIGTTFAWFTDTASTGVNKIQAGTLDVELVDENGNSLEGKTLEFVKASNAPDGEAILWEPGCTYTLPNVYVKNNGNLALKYTIVISGIDGDAKLNEAIEWMISGSESGSILAGSTTSDPISISGHMKEEAGNEYQGLSIDGIAITVYATQYTYEYDSNDNQYDANADYDDLTSDVVNVLDAELALSNQAAENIVASTKTFQGLGSDVSTLTFTNGGNGFAYQAAEGSTLTFTDLTIVDETVDYAEASWEFGYLEFGGKLYFENVVFADPIMLEDGADATFVNCTFTGKTTELAQYGVWVDEGTATFEGCTFTGTRGLKIHEAYGSEVSSVTVDGCTFLALSEKPGVAIGTLNADTTVSITNSSFISCQAGDQSLYIYETDTDVTTFTFVNKDNAVMNADDLDSEDAAVLNAELALSNQAAENIVASTKTFQGFGADVSTLTFTNGGNGFAYQAAEGSTLTFTDLTIVDETVDYAEASWEFGYLEFGGKLYFENVVFADPIMLEDGADATFVNCTFTGKTTELAQYGVWVDEGTATFEGCTFTGTRGLKIHEAYGSEVSSVTVDGCTFLALSEKPGVAIGTLNADTTVSITNSSFVNCQAGDQSLYIYETDTDVTTFAFTSSGNTVK